jgi:hypothetical protein
MHEPHKRFAFLQEAVGAIPALAPHLQAVQPADSALSTEINLRAAGHLFKLSFVGQDITPLTILHQRYRTTRCF